MSSVAESGKNWTFDIRILHVVRYSECRCKLRLKDVYWGCFVGYVGYDWVITRIRWVVSSRISYLFVN